MRAVWKYDLPIDDEPHVFNCPRGARFVHVDQQGGVGVFGAIIRKVQLWAVVDKSAASWEDRRFVVRGTGHDVPDNESYIGSVVVADGALVWHIFEVYTG